MRISDWSSDVCSSDLTEFVSEAELVRHRSEDLSSKSVKGIDVNISLVDPMQDAADAFTHFAGGASTERDCKQTVRRRALFEHVEISSGKDTSLPGSGRGDYQCRFVSSLRSEEHTSELQSLMRISYAVICLKKK